MTKSLNMGVGRKSVVGAKGFEPQAHKCEAKNAAYNRDRFYGQKRLALTVESSTVRDCSHAGCKCLRGNEIEAWFVSALRVTRVSKFDLDRKTFRT